MADSSKSSAAVLVELRHLDLWPPAIPSAVLIECLTGDSRRDARANRFVKTCKVVEPLPETLARRAAALRTAARRGSAVDALVVATAEPGGVVLTGDNQDLKALAANAHGVTVRSI